MGDIYTGGGMSQPTGTVTFLFTDIVGSTELAQRHPDAMPALLTRHNDILRLSIESQGGYVFENIGDAFACAFHAAPPALAAALDAQRALQAEPWHPEPVRVRMGIHTGAAQAVANPDASPRYAGYSSLARVQRIMSAAHGGQILISNTSAELVRDELFPGVSLRDMGEHRLKGLLNPEHLWQVVAPDLPQDFPRLRTLDVIPNNLPIPLNSFIGRRRELREITERVARARLLTLFGPGGTGKTRLALQAATELLETFEDRVYFVDLAPARDPESVLAAIGRTIGLCETSNRALLDEIEVELRPRKTLLLLDNFEQVTAAAPIIAELLKNCPQLHIIATSREALHVQGEQVFPVPPLELPGEIKQLSIEQLAETEAVQLFMERARAVKPDFVLTNENAQAVAEVCARLDGLPLAIELATARLNVLSPQAVLERLGNRLRLLRGGARDQPARQQTLRATIDWSYERLAPGEQQLFQLLSVFTGASFEAVEAVASRIERFDEIELDILDGLGSLVDKSLVRQTNQGTAESRVQMLESIREYAASRLEEDPEFSAAARRAHATYFAELTRRLWEPLTGDGRETALAQLTADLENIRTAWRYWVAEGNLGELRKLADSLWLFYDARGWYHATVELATQLLQVLAATTSSPEHAHEQVMLQTSLARVLLAIKGYTSGEVEQAYTRALELCQKEGEIPQLFPVLRSLATYYQSRGDLEKAVQMGERILSLAEHLNDADMRVDAHVVLGSNLGTMDNMILGLNHLEKGIAAFDPQRKHSRRLRLGANSGVVCLAVSGFFLWMLGFPDRARERAKDAVALARRLDHPFSLSYALFHSGLLHIWLREPDIAQAHALALLDVAEEHGFQVWSAVGTCLNGTALAERGAPEEGLALTRRGIEIYQGLVTPPVFFTLLLSLEASTCGLANKPAEGLALLDQAIEITGTAYGRIFLVEFYRLKADLLLALSRENMAQAEMWLERAMSIAREQSAGMLELRAAVRLSALWQEQGKVEEAQKLLSETYAKFSEGFATVDLREAQALLQSMTKTA